MPSRAEVACIRGLVCAIVGLAIVAIALALLSVSAGTNFIASKAGYIIMGLMTVYSGGYWVVVTMREPPSRYPEGPEMRPFLREEGSLLCDSGECVSWA